MKSFLASVLSGLIGSLPLAAVFVFYTLPSFEKQTFAYKNQGTSIAVQTAFEILNTFHKRQLSGELSEAEAKSLASKMVGNLRYQNDEYLWINDIFPRMIMHPIKPELNGQDVSEHKDAHGKKLFTEMVNVVKAHGEGYVEYDWTKPNSSEPVPKISYVKLFVPWNWIIGSGVYVDDVQAEMAGAKHKNLLFFGLSLLALMASSIIVANRQIKRWVIPVQRVMSKLDNESASLTSSADELKSSAEQMQSVGVEQHSAILQISSAITEITDMIKTSSDIAQKSSLLSRQTAQSAQQGQTSVVKVHEALDVIATTKSSTLAGLSEMRQNIRSMYSMMSEIASKTSLIDDIVFQTKLLSFNASVEAARAGEHGKGFSVVAEEIRKLAKQSGDSSLQIRTILERSKTLFEEIITKSDLQAQQIVQGNEAALVSGSKAVAECSALLAALGSEAQEAYTMSVNILEAYQAQSKGAEEILKGIYLIDDKTNAHMKLADQNQQLSEVVADNAESLSGIVIHLKTASQGDKAA